MTKVGSDIKSNPKRFWTYVKSLKCSSTIPSVMTYDNREYSSFRDIAKAFSQYFQSVFTVSSVAILPNCITYDVPSFCVPHVTPDQMRDHIQALNRHTCSEYDNLSAVFLIECANELCRPLSQIFNLSCDHGEYPSLLKHNNLYNLYNLYNCTYL